MFPYNIVEDQAKALIHACAEKNIGFIAMKPLAGGAIEDAVTALRYVCANPDVTVVIPGMADIAELNQNLAAVNDSSPLSVEEEARCAPSAMPWYPVLPPMQLLPAMQRGYQHFQRVPV